MATKDGFNPDDFLPLFLSDFLSDEPLPLVLSDKPVSRADKPFSLSDEAEQQQGIGNDKAVNSLRFTVASILVAAATASGISILSAGNPVTLFAGITASPADKSARQRLWEEAALPPGSSPHSTEQSTPIIQSVVIQSTADAEALPPTVQDVPAREIKAPEPARKTQETDEASSEALFRKFQAWNAEQDARDSAKPVVAKNASASVRPMQKQQKARTTPNAKQTEVQYAEPLSFLRELLPF
jgi:hypothetical protein